MKKTAGLILYDKCVGDSPPKKEKIILNMTRPLGLQTVEALHRWLHTSFPPSETKFVFADRRKKNGD